LHNVEEGGEYRWSREACQRLPHDNAKNTQMNLYQAALNYVARYATSQENLRRVLWRKVHRDAAKSEQGIEDAGNIEQEISEIITRLISIGAIDDGAYAATQVRTLRARGTSARHVQARLAAKGIDPEITIAALALADSGADDGSESQSAEHAAALAFAKRRRLGSYRTRPGKPDQHQRDLAALCRAGFSFAVAKEVIGAL
jgi:regulatory protein